MDCENYFRRFYSMVEVLDENRLSFLLNNTERFVEAYDLLRIIRPDSNKQEGVNVNIDKLKEQVEYQKGCVESAIKYKYLAGRLFQHNRLNPLMRHHKAIIDRLIIAEECTYQVMLNYLESKKEISQKNKEKKRRRKNNKKFMRNSYESWS